MEAKEAERLVEQLAGIKVVLAVIGIVFSLYCMAIHFNVKRIADALERAYPPKAATEKP